MSPPTLKQLARAQLREIDSACAAALSDLKTEFTTNTDLMDAKLSADMDSTMADYEAKYQDLKAAVDAELDGLKAAYMTKLDDHCDAYKKEHGDTFEGYCKQKLALARGEGYWGLTYEEVKEVLGFGEGRGGDGKEAEKSAEADEGITVLGSKDAAFSSETEAGAPKKSITSVGSKKTASSLETEMDAKEKSRTSVVSKDATSSLQTRIPGTKERPIYEQKVMVLDSDQMAALEVKLANSMRRRH